MNGLLPAWSGRLRRDIKRWHAFQRAQVVFLSPAKSGRTWVRAMLSHAYHLSYGTPVDQLVNRDRFHRLEARIPRFFFSHGNSESGLVRRRLTPAGLGQRTLVCLVRDPRDLVVSFHHQRRHRSKPRRHAPQPLPETTLTAERALAACADAARKVDWLRGLAAAHGNGHLFRYEDFRRDPTRELQRLLGALGHHLPQDHVEAAVAFTAFDNLKKREAAGFYRNDNLRPGDAAEPNSFKVRRGKVGGYRDELAVEQIQALDRLIDATLETGLGYRSDERRCA